MVVKYETEVEISDREDEYDKESILPVNFCANLIAENTDNKTDELYSLHVPNEQKSSDLNHLFFHIKSEPSERDFVSKECNKNFISEQDMEKHQIMKHTDVKIYADEEINDDRNPDDQKVIKQTECSLCKKNFLTRRLLLKHLKEVHGRVKVRRKRSEINAQFFCNICNKGYTRKFDVKKHMHRMHPDAIKEEEEEDSEEKHKNNILLESCKVDSVDGNSHYKCKMCQKMFRHASNFLRHYSIHTGARPFYCDICGKNFRVLSGLNRHIRETHYGMRKFLCEICNNSFASKATLMDHINIHTNNRPFVCDECGKSFKQKASLHTHKLFHTNVFRFECPCCQKKFRRASELKVHSYLHSGIKPHKCHICPSSFRLSQDLKRHLRVHDRLVECSCDICGSTFSQARYLKTHMKTHKCKGDAKRENA